MSDKTSMPFSKFLGKGIAGALGRVCYRYCGNLYRRFDGVFALSENGGAAVGTVTRSNTDVGSALVVALSSNDTTEATVPLTVVIPAHESSASFSVNSVDDTLLDGTQVVTITGAAAGYVDGAAELDVTDSETLTLTINAASISENGGAAIGTVTRGNTDTDQALVVELASSDTTEALVPASVTVPAHASSATFEITARDDRLLDGTQVSAISSSAVGYVEIGRASWRERVSHTV